MLLDPWCSGFHSVWVHTSLPWNSCTDILLTSFQSQHSLEALLWCLCSIYSRDSSLVSLYYELSHQLIFSWLSGQQPNFRWTTPINYILQSGCVYLLHLKAAPFSSVQYCPLFVCQSHFNRAGAVSSGMYPRWPVIAKTSAAHCSEAMRHKPLLANDLQGDETFLKMSFMFEFAFTMVIRTWKSPPPCASLLSQQGLECS